MAYNFCCKPVCFSSCCQLINLGFIYYGHSQLHKHFSLYITRSFLSFCHNLGPTKVIKARLSHTSIQTSSLFLLQQYLLSPSPLCFPLLVPQSALIFPFFPIGPFPIRPVISCAHPCIPQKTPHNKFYTIVGSSCLSMC